MTPSNVLTELQTAAARKWQGDQAAQSAGLFARAAAEIERQQREREVFARWIAEACGVLASVEDEAEDGGESLRILRERGDRLVRAVLGPPPPRTDVWVADTDGNRKNDPLYGQAELDAAVAAERARCAAIARRWGETHADGVTVNARNAASKIARGIEGPNV